MTNNDNDKKTPQEIPPQKIKHQEQPLKDPTAPTPDKSNPVNPKSDEPN